MTTIMQNVYWFGVVRPALWSKTASITHSLSCLLLGYRTCFEFCDTRVVELCGRIVYYVHNFASQKDEFDLNFWRHIFRLRNWNFTKFRHFEQNIMKFYVFWLKWGLVELKNAEKGSYGVAEGVWNGGLYCRTFQVQGKSPPRGLLSSQFARIKLP